MAELGSNTGLIINLPVSQGQRLNFFEQQIDPACIAINKNLDVDGVLNCQDNVSIYNPAASSFTDEFLNFSPPLGGTTITVAPAESTSSSTPVTFSSLSKQSKIDLFEEEIVNNYIATQKNKHIFGVLQENLEASFYYSPNYSYGADAIHTEQQIVVIHDGGGGGGGDCQCHLYWQDIVAV